MTTATFKSADGSIRCHACHLHPDRCTCAPGNSLHVLLGAIVEARPMNPASKLWPEANPNVVKVRAPWQELED